MRGFRFPFAGLLLLALAFLSVCTGVPDEGGFYSTEVVHYGGHMPVSHGSRYDLYQNETWYIGADTTIDGKSICLRSDIVINASFILELRNTTISYDVGSNGAFGITLAQGSGLSMHNSSITSLTYHKFGLKATRANITMDSSSLKGCGGSGGPKGSRGLEMAGGNLTMDGSNITFGDYGIYAEVGSVRLNSSEVISNGNDGIHANGSFVSLENSTVSSNSVNGIFAQNGSLAMSGCTIKDNWQIGVWSRFANITIAQTVFANQAPDLRVERLAGIEVVAPNMQTIPGVNIVVKTLNGIEVFNGTSGPDGKTTRFPVTTVILDDGTYVNGTPVTVRLNRSDHIPAEQPVDIQDNSYHRVVLYPVSHLYVFSLESSAQAVLVGTNVQANLTLANSGFDAVNVTVEFRLDSVPIGRHFYPVLAKGATETLNASWNATHGNQALEAVVDVDRNSSESGTDLLDNSASLEVLGVVGPNVSLVLSANRTYAGGVISLNASGTTGDALLEWRFDLGDENVTAWQADPAFEHPYQRTGAYNLSAQARTRIVLSAKTYIFESPWHPNISLGVYEHGLPVALFTITPDAGNVTTTFLLNASSSYWMDLGSANRSGLVFIWALDGVEFLNGSRATASLNLSDDVPYNLSLRVVDPFMAASEAFFLTLKPQNLPPIARMDLVDRMINASLPYTLDVSAAQTQDPDDPLSELVFLWSVDNNTMSGRDQKIIFNKAGTYEVTLTVKDDDNATSYVKAVIVVNDAGGGGGGDGLGSGAYIIIAIVALIIVIVIVICVVLLIRNPEAFDRFTGKGLSVTDEHLKLETGKKEDFVIVKKGASDVFKKYELYKVAHQEDSYLCVAWTSRADVEWQIIGTFTGSRDAVLRRINSHLDVDVGRRWSIDYWGNGKIVSGRTS